MTDNVSAHLEAVRGLALLVGPTLQPPSRKSFYTAAESGAEPIVELGDMADFHS
jgi:hypothetical protein